MSSGISRGRWAAAWAIALLAASVGAASSQPVVTTRAMLEANPQLGDRVSLKFQDQPLAVALRSLNNAGKLRFTATREMADEKGTLYLTDRTTGDVLATLAEQFDGVWRKTGDGYRLERSPAELRRAAESTSATLRATDRWMERLAALSDSPVAQLQARRQEVERKLAQPDLPAEQSAPLREEADLLRDRFRHEQVIPLIVRVYRSLTTLERRQLLTLGQVRVTSGSDLGNNPPVRRLARAMLAPGEWENRPPLFADFTFQFAENSSDAERRRGRRSLRLQAVATLVTGKNRDASGSSGVNWQPRVPNPEIAPEFSPTLTTEPALTRVVQLPLSSRREENRPEQGVLAAAMWRWPKDLVSVGTVTNALQEATGLEFVADSFARAHLPAALLRQPLPVVQVLDTLARELDFSWRMQGNLVLLTSLHRPDDRALEVPERVLARYRPQFAKQSPTVDELASLAEALTDRQCQGLEDGWVWYFPEGGTLPPWGGAGFFQARYALRFWHSLAPRQRQASFLESGLPTLSLTPIQWARWVFAFGTPDELWSPQEIAGIPPIQDLPGKPTPGQFRLKTRQQQARSYRNSKGERITSFGPVRFDSPYSGAFGEIAPEDRFHQDGPGTATQNVTFVFTFGIPEEQAGTSRTVQFHLLPAWK